MKWRLCLGVALIAVATGLSACGGSDSTPQTPNPPTTPPPPAALTLTAPAAVSPVDGTVANSVSPTLVLRASTGSNQTTTVSYEIQIRDANDQLVYERTVAGGPANGQSNVSHQVESQLSRWRTYKWRARAVSGSTTSPWSDASTNNATFVTTRPNVSASNDEFREFFFDLVSLKGVGATATEQGLRTMEADIAATGTILAKETSGFIRGRLYLPTGNPADKYARSVDVVSAPYGTAPWTWLVKGRTTCEGICP